ncbi:hypothetical protein [uncultured Robinsoniella sp.]|uniref:hypothetical protein n=1 Tax=uncultured Robinsoniella sp. TaxID=904190 RepID=UPI00374EF89C
MIDVKISYELALKLEIYMEKDIEDVAQSFRDLSYKYKEKCNYNADKNAGIRSFHTDYNITENYYKKRVKELRIRQYSCYLELERFLELCKEQNGGRPYIGHRNNLIHELICFNPSCDIVKEELERLLKE